MTKNIQELKANITDNINSTKILKNELYQKQYELEKSYGSQIHKKEQWLHELQEEYKDLAWNKAIDEGQCPSSRWGSPLEPTDIHCSENELTLTWEHEHPYHASHFDYFSITWEDLLKYADENKEKTIENKETSIEHN